MAQHVDPDTFSYRYVKTHTRRLQTYVMAHTRENPPPTPPYTPHIHTSTCSQNNHAHACTCTYMGLSLPPLPSCNSQTRGALTQLEDFLGNVVAQQEGAEVEEKHWQSNQEAAMQNLLAEPGDGGSAEAGGEENGQEERDGLGSMCQLWC